MVWCEDRTGSTNRHLAPLGYNGIRCFSHANRAEDADYAPLAWGIYRRICEFGLAKTDGNTSSQRLYGVGDSRLSHLLLANLDLFNQHSAGE